MDSKSLARYKAALRRYNSNPITKKQAKTVSSSGYEQAKYLGFDVTTGSYRFETSSGIKATKSLSNNAIPKDGYGLYSQGFSINPYS